MTAHKTSFPLQPEGRQLTNRDGSRVIAPSGQQAISLIAGPGYPRAPLTFPAAAHQDAAVGGQRVRGSHWTILLMRHSGSQAGRPMLLGLVIPQ